LFSRVTTQPPHPARVPSRNGTQPGSTCPASTRSARAWADRALTSVPVAAAISVVFPASMSARQAAEVASGTSRAQPGGQQGAARGERGDQIPLPGIELLAGEGLDDLPVLFQGAEDVSGAGEALGFGAQVPHRPRGALRGHIRHHPFGHLAYIHTAPGSISGECGGGRAGRGGHELPDGAGAERGGQRGPPGGAHLRQGPGGLLALPGVEVGLAGEVVADRAGRIVAVLAAVGAYQRRVPGLDLVPADGEMGDHADRADHAERDVADLPHRLTRPGGVRSRGECDTQPGRQRGLERGVVTLAGGPQRALPRRGPARPGSWVPARGAGVNGMPGLLRPGNYAHFQAARLCAQHRDA